MMDVISKLLIYVNGTSVSYSGNIFSGIIDNSIKPLLIGQREVGDLPFNGSIDEIRIYNRTLDGKEVTALCQQPDPASLIAYYNYQDPVTNNKMVIQVGNANVSISNVTLVTCTAFFIDNRLAFQANNSAILNVWTTLGRPLFTTGVWNNDNYTTSLTLNAFSSAELNWNQGTPPSGYVPSIFSTIAGKTITFSTLWNDNQSLSSAGYIFSTNNTGLWINASWAPFNSNPCWGNVSLTLNSTFNVVVGFREYANNSLNLWGDSGIYAITTTKDAIGTTPTPMPSSVLSASPTPSPKSTPTSMSTPSTNPSKTPPVQPETEQFPIQTASIIAIAMVVLIAILVLAFKKGYIIIETIDAENPQVTSDDYSI